MQAKELLERNSARINAVIKKILEDETLSAQETGRFPSYMVKAFSDMVTKGKGLRGSLLLMGYELSGQKPTTEILKAAAAIEIFHAGLLVHDDFMDKAETRRGIPTLNITYASKVQKVNPYVMDVKHLGNSLAIDLGDLTFFLVFKILNNLKIDLEVKQKVVSTFTDYAIRVIYGQALDLVNSNNLKASEREIANVIWMKSGEYTSMLPLDLGLKLSGNQNKSLEKAIQEYARGFGYAFQIQDDYLGIYGNPKVTGKPNESDLREGKMTLFVLHLLKTQEYNDFLEDNLGNPSTGPKEVEQFRKILEKSGVKDKVIKISEKYVQTGIESINGLKNVDASTKLKFVELIQYMIARLK